MFAEEEFDTVIEVITNGNLSEIVMDDGQVNAISEAFLADFHQALDTALKASPTAILIRSGRKVFCAGADLKRIQALFQSETGIDDMVTYVRKFHDLFDRIEQLPAVTMAVINGAALGGGLELALSCDLRVAACEAKLGLPEARVGMIPGAGGTQRLARLCGPGVANRIILGCDIVDGIEAVRLGLVEKSYPLEELEDNSREWAMEIAGLAKPALLASKDCIAAYFDNDINGFERELEKPFVTMRSQEAQERISAFFNK